MRSVCTWLLGSLFACALFCVAPGCDGGGASNLEAQPEVKQNASPSEMPGFDKMQDQLKKEKKIK